MEKLYTVSKNKTDCGSDHELLIAKFRLKLKKVGTATRPFRYDLNQSILDLLKLGDLGHLLQCSHLEILLESR